MKRFRFAFATLLKVKERREQLAEARVARARLELEACRARLAHWQDALSALSTQLEQSLGVTLANNDWAKTVEQTTGLERAIRAAEAEVQAAEQALQEAIQERVKIATEVEVLETLKQQRFELYQQDMQRAEQVQLDEFGLRQWMKARRKTGGGSP